ncbi:TPA: 50S ribosomal protein L7ae [Bacillus cereus]|nr:50S ribosomal protein L7ae [Bacillus cereus]
MSIGSTYNHVTSKEIMAIHAYVTGDVISQSTALNFLKRFDPEEKPGNNPSGIYFISNQGESIYEYYKGLKPNLFAKQRLDNYEELKHRAIDYCFENTNLSL